MEVLLCVTVRKQSKIYGGRCDLTLQALSPISILKLYFQLTSTLRFIIVRTVSLLFQTALEASRNDVYYPLSPLTMPQALRINGTSSYVTLSTFMTRPASWKLSQSLSQIFLVVIKFCREKISKRCFEMKKLITLAIDFKGVSMSDYLS